MHFYLLFHLFLINVLHKFVFTWKHLGNFLTKSSQDTIKVILEIIIKLFQLLIDFYNKTIENYWSMKGTLLLF